MLFRSLGITALGSCVSAAKHPFILTMLFYGDYTSCVGKCQQWKHLKIPKFPNKKGCLDIFGHISDEDTLTFSDFWLVVSFVLASGGEAVSKSSPPRLVPFSGVSILKIEIYCEFLFLLYEKCYKTHYSQFLFLSCT